MLEPTRTASKTLEDLTSFEKAAVVLIALGKEKSAVVMRGLPEREIERLTAAIAGLRNIDPTVELEILKEFYTMIQASEYLNQGGNCIRNIEIFSFKYAIREKNCAT